MAAKAVVRDGTARLTTTPGTNLTSGMTVRVGDLTGRIAQVQQDTWGMPVATAPLDLANGEYDVVIVVESIAPIRFLLGV